MASYSSMFLGAMTLFEASDMVKDLNSRLYWCCLSRSILVHFPPVTAHEEPRTSLLQ